VFLTASPLSSSNKLLNIVGDGSVFIFADVVARKRLHCS
jgi:hypothetical protein